MTARRARWIALALLCETSASSGVAFADRWLWPHASMVERRCREVASYVEAHAAPGARILVWGNSPEIYYLAHRLPATRFVSSNYQTGHVWGTASNRDGAMGDLSARSAVAWDRMLDDLRQTTPVLIIDAAAGGLGHMERDPIDRQPELRQWLRATCRRQTEVAGIPIYACRAPSARSASAAPPASAGESGAARRTLRAAVDATLALDPAAGVLIAGSHLGMGTRAHQQPRSRVLPT